MGLRGLIHKASGVLERLDLGSNMSIFKAICEHSELATITLPEDIHDGEERPNGAFQGRSAPRSTPYYLNEGIRPVIRNRFRYDVQSLVWKLGGVLSPKCRCDRFNLREATPYMEARNSSSNSRFGC